MVVFADGTTENVDYDRLVSMTLNPQHDDNTSSSSAVSDQEDHVHIKKTSPIQKRQNKKVCRSSNTTPCVSWINVNVGASRPSGSRLIPTPRDYRGGSFEHRKCVQHSLVALIPQKISWATSALLNNTLSRDRDACVKDSGKVLQDISMEVVLAKTFLL